MEELERTVDEFLRAARKPLIEAVRQGRINLQELKDAIGMEKAQKSDDQLESLGRRIAKTINEEEGGSFQTDGELEKLGTEIADMVNHE